MWYSQVPQLNLVVSAASGWNSLQQPRDWLMPSATSTFSQSASFLAPVSSIYPAFAPGMARADLRGLSLDARKKAGLKFFALVFVQLALRLVIFLRHGVARGDLNGFFDHYEKPLVMPQARRPPASAMPSS